METNISFKSDGVDIVGVMHRPDDLRPGEKRPLIIATHGFGGSKIDGSMATVCPILCDWGYIAVRFDSRGCGESGGERGRVICMDQVNDLGNAIDWLVTQDNVDPDQIILLGDSLGAAVSLYTGGSNDKVSGVIAVGGWGNGLEKSKLQHAGEGAWDKYQDMLKRGREHKAKTGESMKVHRFDIVPIPMHMRDQLPDDAIMEFPVDTAESICSFMPINVIGNLAPRPLLLMHAATDAVTPTDSTLEVFQHANLPKDLVLLSGLDHFPLGTADKRLYNVLRDWLDLHFALK